MHLHPLSVTVALGALAGRTFAQDADYTKYVDPFHGTENGGNMFPGVVPAPFSVVKLGPDVSSGTTDAYSGYLPTGNVTGFSMMHESGTGGAPKYGVVSQMGVVGAVSNPLLDLSAARAVEDQARVGYYRSELTTGVVVDLAGTNHAGFYHWTFPRADTHSIVVDVSHVLPSFRGLGWGQQYTGGNFEVFPDGHYEGNGTYNGGWNLSPDWTIHFCGRFDITPSSSKTFSGVDQALSQYGESASVSGTERLGGVFTFNETSVSSRVGISFISSAKACAFIDSEIPAATGLDSLVRASQETWNAEVLRKVETSSTNATLLTQLYSSLYGMHLIPSNRTGENPKWESSEPYYDDIFTFWDLFRCTTALIQVLQPEAYEEQIRSLIDIWRHDGWMPDARSSNFNGRVQGGSNADNVLADAYVKGVRGAVNWEDGFKAMLADAEKAPPGNNDPSTAPDTSSTAQGRGALPDWIRYGYITPAYSRAVSRAVEYSANDFGLYQVATGLDDTTSAAKYLNRSRNWRNHWNPNASSRGFTGFVVPRKADGSFVAQDPQGCGGCYWADPYYEDNSWTYSFNAHHDMATTVELMGGTSRFVARLDEFFDAALYNPANEPGFTTPYLYNFAGRQDRTVARLRDIAGQRYGAGRDGIPGNSDAGAMQSWILWNMLGLYPVTGQTTFLVGSPWFERVAVDLGNGRRLVVSSSGGEEGPYVQSLRVNGQQWDRAWVAWEDVFARGGEMEFVLGAQAAEWATGDLPPSPAVSGSGSVGSGGGGGGQRK
ncbi:glycoside hydrolase family 92 protein [Aplosporella prunicola CBS 121167]|uniref:Glycoside hydrolase family 92 protein n=1 Tax=Aplosporella prunicola CBS 121167 TaxID=1176127 RepID=A0A6A6BAE7_9PEZI|nr:glycoside hydrolase family 92 protein [Aplosporella prunicola CBS 121167]KAF2140996.1 glycoside hydrolase family 92 protein [Aplosporella prunicola CBS 121167]